MKSRTVYTVIVYLIIFLWLTAHLYNNIKVFRGSQSFIILWTFQPSNGDITQSKIKNTEIKRNAIRIVL